MRSKARIGDICEIATPAGLAYVQYTHDADKAGQIVRVLPGLFRDRPDLAELARQRELYFVFYTLDYAIRDRQAEIVAHEPIPFWAIPEPLMRWCGARDPSGKAIAWKIFRALTPLTLENQKRTPIILELSPEQEKLSIHKLWPHPVMVKELARGWTPARAEELRRRDLSEAVNKNRPQVVSELRQGESMRHFLYFSEKSHAENVGDKLRDVGFSVRVRKAADATNWLVLAENTPPSTAEEMDDVRDLMEGLAVQFGGEYDGWEAAIDSLCPDGDGRNVN